MNREYTLDLATSSVKPDKELGESDIEEMVKMARAFLAKDAGCVLVWNEEWA